VFSLNLIKVNNVVRKTPQSRKLFFCMSSMWLVVDITINSTALVRLNYHCTGYAVNQQLCGLIPEIRCVIPHFGRLTRAFKNVIPHISCLTPIIWGIIRQSKSSLAIHLGTLLSRGSLILLLPIVSPQHQMT
jgi:hypothetical protein